MKALTLTQPWASLVAVGAKRIETRSWRTDYRGPIAIHAAKGWTADDRDFAADLIARGVIPLLDGMPRGCVVAIAWLWDVIPTEKVPQAALDREGEYGDYSPGRWAWGFRHIETLTEPRPARGALGLWDLCDPILESWSRAELSARSDLP